MTSIWPEPWCFMIASILIAAVSAFAPPSDQTGAHRFDAEGPGGAELPVYMHVPEQAGADAPVVLVFHGASRNPDDYRDAWSAIADACGVVIAAPGFSRARFPGADGYNLGGLGTGGENAFDWVEPVFDAVRTRYGLDAEGYYAFGHSAGSQFLHRFLFFTPQSRLIRGVGANAGWYTRPDPSVAWPYGFKDAPAVPIALGAVPALPFEIHLGALDSDPQGENVRRDALADAQGDNRLARGLSMAAYVNAMGAQAGEGWRVEIVPAVAHDNARMAPAAARALLPPRLQARPACAALLHGRGHE